MPRARQCNSSHEKIADVMVNSRIILPTFLVAIVAAFSLPASSAQSKSDADERSGAILYRDKGCAFCHGQKGEGGKKGPPLADIRSDKDWPAEKLTDHILNGGQKMPPFRDSLTDDETAQLVAFLRAKKWPVPPPIADPTANPPAPPQ